MRALANGVRSACVRGRNAGNPQQLASWQSSVPVGKIQGTFRQRQEQHTVTWLQLLDQMSEYSLPEYDWLYVKVSLIKYNIHHLILSCYQQKCFRSMRDLNTLHKDSSLHLIDFTTGKL